MIFFSLFYYFIQHFYDPIRFKSNTNLYLKKIKTNDYHYGMKKNDSKESLDQYFTSSNEVLLNRKKRNNKSEGYDERYPILELDNYLFMPVYNSSLYSLLSSNFTNQDPFLPLYNQTVSYKINLEEYKTLLLIKLFFLKKKFLSYLESPKISTITKTKLIEKYDKKNNLFHQKLKNGGLFKDYEDFQM